MWPKGPAATDGHRSNGYPGLRQVVDPVYPRERRLCGLYVDEQVLGTHYRLHIAREEDAASTNDESDPEDPTVAWCPPISDAAEDPSEDEIVSAADQLAILITNVQPNGNPFCIPENLGILPPLWLQARLTLSLTAIQEKFVRILLSVACELWLRGQIASVEDVL